jgi:hypothetical protein
MMSFQAMLKVTLAIALICACLYAFATLAWSLLSNVFAVLSLLLKIAGSITSTLLWIPQLMLSLFPGVSGLLQFLVKTAVYTVFQTHLVFVWDHLIICTLLAAAARQLVGWRRKMKEQTLFAYFIFYSATFLYITVSTLLPMFLLAAAVGLLAKAICHFFPAARPKHTGPFMCFVVSLFFHVYFEESSEVSEYFWCRFLVAYDCL